MNFRLQPRKKTSYRRFLLGGALALFLGAVVLGVGVPDIIRRPVAYVAGVIQQADAVANARTLFQSRQELAEENERLVRELNEARLAVIDRNILREENEELKSLLGREGTGRAGVLAGVLSRPGVTPYDILIIDAGDNDGVAVGDVVRVGDSLRIGEVSDVFSETARVTLYSTPGRQTDAYVPSNELAVTLEGRGGGAYSIRLPDELSVRRGARVVSRDVGAGVFGVVEAVETEGEDAFQTVHVSMPISLQELRWVIVET